MAASLSADERDFLLDLAYQAVKATAERSALPDVRITDLSIRLRNPTATFVTLNKEGALRGCIGTTKVQQALALDVIQRASAAASRDPRFPAVTPDELPFIDIEISMLTPPEQLHYASSENLLDQLREGQCGVILQKDVRRATFLPQVWERVPDPQTFLELLCQKASLHRDAWRNEDLQIEIYQVEKFHRKARSPQ